MLIWCFGVWVSSLPYIFFVFCFVFFFLFVVGVVKEQQASVVEQRGQKVKVLKKSSPLSFFVLV
jgi:hypothetical protein